jgi:hypothetical protein
MQQANTKERLRITVLGAGKNTRVPYSLAHPTSAVIMGLIALYVVFIDQFEGFYGKGGQLLGTTLALL